MTEPTIHLALPKGRMQAGVFALLAEAGLQLRTGPRNYRPQLSQPGFEVKILKPQNIVEMLHHGTRDVGFAGADWVAELRADVVEVLDTGLDPVRIVAAAPAALAPGGELRAGPLVVVSELERLTRDWLARRGSGHTFVRSYGATEVFPPEDADCIVDVTASGATLAANGLVIVDELMTSSTRLYASPKALRDARRSEAIGNLRMVLAAVLEARRRVMLEVNVSADRLEDVVALLPCMREPTIAPLHGDAGYAVRAAVPRDELPRLIPAIKARGGTDIVVGTLTQIVP